MDSWSLTPDHETKRKPAHEMKRTPSLVPQGGDPNRRSHHVTKSWEPSCSRRPLPHRATRKKPDTPHKACFVKRYRLRLCMPSKQRCWPYGPLYTVLQIARRQPAHLGLGLTGLGSPEYRSPEGNLFYSVLASRAFESPLHPSAARDLCYYPHTVR